MFHCQVPACSRLARLLTFVACSSVAVLRAQVRAERGRRPGSCRTGSASPLCQGLAVPPASRRRSSLKNFFASRSARRLRTSGLGSSRLPLVFLRDFSLDSKGLLPLSALRNRLEKGNVSGNRDGCSLDYDLSKSLFDLDSHVIESLYRTPAWRELLDKQMLAVSILILLGAITVVAIIGFGLSWLLGWLSPLNVVSLVILSVMAIAWFMSIRMWRSGRQDRQQFEWMRHAIVTEAVDLNEQFLARHIKGDEPFMLFLRSFDIEAVVGFGTTPGRPRSCSAGGSSGPVEVGLAKALKGSIAAYAVTNPLNFPGSYRTGLPTITIPSAVWRETLARLVERAAFIVVDATEITAGLTNELQMLDNSNKRQRTVVITPIEADRNRIAERNRMVARTGAEWIFSTAVDAAQSDRILAQFSRKVRSDQVDFSSLESVPAFSGLIRDVPQSTPDARLRLAREVLMHFMRQKQKAPDEYDENFKKLLSEITSQQHWIMFTAEFLDADRALRAVSQLSFFNEGSLTPVISAGVFGHRNGATVVLGGELTRLQVDEISFIYFSQAQEFDMRWEKLDAAAEERSAPARSLLKLGLAGMQRPAG
jgi:hypothetical protein